MMVEVDSDLATHELAPVASRAEDEGARRRSSGEAAAFIELTRQTSIKWLGQVLHLPNWGLQNGQC